MKKIRIRHLILIALIFVQCSVDQDESNLDLIQGENVQNEDNKASDSTNQSSSDSSNSVTQTSFEHQKMLINWADNIIIPSILNFESSLSELKEIASLFANNPSSDGLSNIREAWLQSFLKWQHVEMFDIGIAEEIYYKNRVNIYPANVDRIENNILNQDYDLNQSSNFSSQGFNGLDYLLFGIGENEDEIILKYSTKNLNYGKYLTDLINKMIELTVEVKNGWNDEYREEFINSTENTSTSSINKLINDFIYYFEKGYRTNKIGIPAGRFSSLPLPEKIEAYYYSKNGFGNLSKTLALEARQAATEFFTGSNSEGVKGPSYSSYLDYLETEIGPTVETKLEEAKVSLESLQDNFIDQIADNNTLMLLAFDALQTIVVNLKTDMLSNFNIAVDYTDADGD